MFFISFDKHSWPWFCQSSTSNAGHRAVVIWTKCKNSSGSNCSLPLHRTRSINVDVEGSLKVGLVGSSISCAGLRLTHISCRPLESLVKQSRLKSPKTSISELQYWASKSAKLLVALEIAEGGLYTPTTWLQYYKESTFWAMNSKEWGIVRAFKTVRDKPDFT